MSPPSAIDWKLIAALCRNGRADIPDISAETDAAPTTVQRRLRALEDAGTIGGYTALLDYEALGYETAVFRLGVELDVIDTVCETLASRREFCTVYQTSGPGRVFAVGTFETETAVAACLRELHDDTDVQEIDVERVVSTHKRGGPSMSGP